MNANKLELGQELWSSKKKHAFVCDWFNRSLGIVEGRMIRKDGTIGKRVLKDRIKNINYAQTILGGCERHDQ